MPTPRKKLISLDSTPYYHVMGRCVRRGFLCGKDAATGKNYEHRRQWIVDRLALLAEVFAIDILSYAVMHNHYHLVIRVNTKAGNSLSDTETMHRWAKLYGLPVLLRQYQAGTLSKEDVVQAQQLIDIRRKRLMDISWFMKLLNEHIARMANAEDLCSGAFWEGRFKSQALLDEKTLLTCMSYVDLNPIRAKIADTPETSDYTSVQARCNKKVNAKVRLALFKDETDQQNNAIPFSKKEYLKLVDWAGRMQRKDKRGYIPSNQPPILRRLGLEGDRYKAALSMFSEPIKAFGSPETVREAAIALGQKWIKGVTSMGVFVKN